MCLKRSVLTSKTTRFCMLFTIIMTSSVFFKMHRTGLVFPKTSREYATLKLRIAFNETLRSFAGNIKTILLWNSFFGEKHFGFGTGQSAFADAGCAVSSCAIWDQEDGNTDLPHDSFDAVVFHVVDIFKDSRPDKMPRVRRPSQLYTFMLLESPATNKFDLRDMLFNVTMTYRRDSDIYSPYGWFASRNISTEPVRRTSSSTASTFWMEPTYEDIQIPRPWTLLTKKKAVAWIASNCDTPGEREVYVNELSRYIAVDVYGNCGTLDCGKSLGDTCYRMVEDEYLFYLSFENSLCTDYVTEKFFKVLKYNVVPVVYGGGDYEIIAPPHSYIDVRNFSSSKELASYLKYLSETPGEYEKYFWWKNYYQVVSGTPRTMFCSLCELLNRYPGRSQGHRDVELWWNGPGVCHSRQEHFRRVPDE